MNIYRYLRGIGAAALLMPAAWAQNAGDVSLRLATQSGKTTFYVGEAVEMEFRFQSTTPGRYAVWTPRPVRQVRQPEYDRFFVEPSAGVADPLADIFAQIGAEVARRPPQPTPLDAEAVTIRLQVNEWLSIRQPGHYRITAESTRVVTTAQPAAPVPLRSNTVEIDVIPAPAGWATAQLSQAVAVLESTDPDGAPAARVLRFLETPEAAQALARFFEQGPQGAQPELRAGLFASPVRKQVIAAMEEQVAAPDRPVTYYYLGALIELVNLSRYGPTPSYTGKTREEMRRWIVDSESPYLERSKGTGPEIFAKLTDAIGRKQGQALAISVATLITRGPQPTPPAVTEALKQSFSSLPEESQAAMLMDGWPQMGSPSMEPLVRTLAEGDGRLREAALLRLQDLNPAAARAIILNRVRKADVLGSLNPYQNQVLLSLPEETLPEADQPLIEALKQGKQVEELISRYASPNARGQLQAWVEEVPGRICDGLLPYFFRVDAAWAASALARIRQRGPGSCAIHLQANADLFMSPGLERQALEDLENPNGIIPRTALTALQYGGSAAARRPLLEAFIRSQQRPPADPADPLTCATDRCRSWATTLAQRIRQPAGITLNAGGPLGYAMLGSMTVYSRKQLEKKIEQYPKGTEFSLSASGAAGTWYHDRAIREAKELLEKAEMNVVEPPSR